MDPDRFSRVSSLFDAARQMPPEERLDYLDSECADDGDLRQAVDTLLRHHEDETSLLDEPIAQTPDDLARLIDRPRAPDPTGLEIGRYRVIRTLGEGGMGIVYLAEQENPKRQVALKVIRSGIASRNLLLRFEHESQVLARLQHPGIAQVFEAGTQDAGRASQPFFAMEFIEGKSLLEYARAHELGTRDRLSLIMQVCDAVHHAHQRGVIHRDLKPGNILVDTSGQPKVLDFGVARVTDSDIQVTTVQTDVGQFIGTLPYMSPEQVLADPEELDTRSDVYALGVLLYEMLTGRLPYDITGLPIPEVARVIRDDDPRRLSACDRALRGDLEAIAGKALEKDKRLRYQSASELAADIGRYLSDEPVIARPQTTLYQFRKLASRHRLPLAAAATIMLLIASSAVVAAVQAGRTARQRDRALGAEQRADERFQETWDLSRALIFDVHDRIASLPGSIEVRELMVRLALENLDGLRQDSEGDPALRRDLASAYTRIGDMQGGYTVANLGDLDGAQQSYEQARDLLEPLADRPDVTPDIVRNLGLAYSKIADVHLQKSRIAEATALYERALSMFRDLRAQSPDEIRVLRAESSILASLGRVHLETRKLDEGLAVTEESIRLADHALELHPNDELSRRQKTYAHSIMGSILEVKGDYEGAIVHQQLAYDLGAAWLAEAPYDIPMQRNQAVTSLERGDALMALGRVDEAVVAYQESLEIREAMAAADPLNTQAAWDIGVGCERLGDALQAAGQLEDAMALQDRALDVRAELIAADPTNTRRRRDLAVAYEKIGNVLLAQADVEGAIERYEESRVLRAELVELVPESGQLQRDLSVTYFKLGVAHATAGEDASRPADERIERWEEARRMFSSALERLREMQQNGLFAESDAHVPDMLQANIDACDEALEELTNQD